MRLRIAGLILAALLLAGALPAAAAPAAARLAVTVTGSGGLPLAGARVELMTPGAGTLATAVTDTAGQAILAAPAAAPAFWVRAWGRGHATVDRPWVPAADGSSLTLELPALTGAFAGLVTDHLGLPVAGARVSAWRKGAGLAAAASTGPDGTYTLRGLPAPGPYLVQVTAPGFRPFAGTPTPVAAGEEQRLDVALVPGAATVAGEAADARSGAPLAGARVELLRQGWGILASTLTGPDGSFALAAPPAEVPDYILRVWAPGHALAASAPFALAPGARRDFSGGDRLLAPPLAGSIWGVLTSEAGTAMADTAVELQLQGAGAVARQTTDAAGFFAFDGVEAGTYRVRALPAIRSGWAPADSPWLPLAPGATRSVELIATAYARRVYPQGTVAGLVTDPAGQPLAGARVTLSRGDEGVLHTATTDARGRYRIPEVAATRPAPADARPPGPGYVVRVELDGYHPSDQPAGGAPLLEVQPARVAQADFTLRPVQGAVAGVVTDDQGQPLAGATITLLREGAGAVARAAAGADGRFRFDGVPAPLRGGYWLQAEQAGYFAAAGEGALAVALAPGGTARASLRLRPAGARLQGRVADATGAPAGGAAVTVLNPVDGRTWELQAGANGWYGADGLPAGPGDVLLVQGAGATAGAVALAGARARTVNLLAAPAGAVAGTVYDPDGAPAAGAAVELWREGETEPVARTRTGPDGTYRLGGLSPGDRYGVTASQEGLRPSSLAPGEATITPLLRAAPGQTLRQDLALGR